MKDRVTAEGSSRVTSSPRRERFSSSGPSVEERPSRRRSSREFPPSVRRPPSVSLQEAVKLWIAEGRSEGWSGKTILDREQALARFTWWLENEAVVPTALDSLTPERMRAFLAYAREARPEGRYGSERPSAKREARPSTVNRYFRELRALANFCLREGLMTETPLKNVKEPRVPKDQIEPFATDQVRALIAGARGGPAPERDAAMILLLIDTGMRSEELGLLLMSDVSRASLALKVTGKGNKTRTVYFSPDTRKALWRYLETRRRDAEAEDALFVSVGGNTPGEALSHTGIHKIVSRAGRSAGIEGVRCSPHTCRHTFAINFLRGGRNVFELQALLGHESLTVLQRYVKLAQSDLSEAHAAASPVKRMKLK